MYSTLWRAFCRQWLEGDAPGSDRVARQRIVLTLTCLVVPGIFLLVSIYPDFVNVYHRAIRHRLPMSVIDDRIEWITFLLTTYSMVGTGFITLFVWESLTFTTRDAMVFGPLPVPPSRLLLAKLGALGTLLAIGAVPIGLVQSLFFALETCEPASLTRFALFFVGILTSVLASAVFAFAMIVALRGAVVFFAGARAADALGPPLQFLFILALLSLVFLSPGFWKTRAITVTLTNLLPPTWFVGLFERMRGSPRAHDLDVAMHFRLAVLLTPMAVVAALALSVMTFRSQMRLALTPASRFDLAGSATIRRFFGRALAGRSPEARATCEFTLLTLVRSKEQQGPIAVGAAVGAAAVIAGLTHQLNDLQQVFQPRAVVFWIPLVVGYWMLIGLRRSFAIPSELKAAWTFRASPAVTSGRSRAGVRAAMIASIVVPLIFGTFLVFTLLVGWRIAVWHAFVVAGVLTCFSELLLCTVDFVPFTRAATPESGRLRALWPVYALGMPLVGYLPAHLEINALADPRLLVTRISALFLAALLTALARTVLSSDGASIQPADDEEAPFETLTILNITG